MINYLEGTVSSLFNFEASQVKTIVRICLQCRTGLDPWAGKSWRRKCPALLWYSAWKIPWMTCRADHRGARADIQLSNYQQNRSAGPKVSQSVLLVQVAYPQNETGDNYWPRPAGWPLVPTSSCFHTWAREVSRSGAQGLMQTQLVRSAEPCPYSLAQ